MSMHEQLIKKGGGIAGLVSVMHEQLIRKGGGLN